jgi:sugar phosphate isomerase/epimerase
MALGTGFGSVLAWKSPAVEPFNRTGRARLLLSLAAYSFRDALSEPKTGAAPPAKRIDLFQFIDYCAEHGCQGTELTSYYFPENPTAEFLLKVKQHAFMRGVEISGTSVGNTFTVPSGEKRDREIANVKRWIDRAQIMGAPHIRVFAGGLEGNTKAEAQKLCIAALEECGEYAGEKGVMLGIENHGGIVAEADGLLEIVHAVKSRWIGVNLDTGNFQSEDPYADMEKCAPYAVNVQYKSEVHFRGRKPEEADLNRVIDILKAAHYQGYVALEYEAAPSPWDAVPGLLQRMHKAFAAGA